MPQQLSLALRAPLVGVWKRFMWRGRAHSSSRDILPSGRVGVQVARLTGTRLRPATDYEGHYTLNLRIRGRHLDVLATPSELGKEMYVVAPGRASLVWEGSLTTGGAAPERYLLSPLNAVLLYEGSDEPLRLRVPRPGQAGEYAVEIRDAGSHAPVGSGTFRLP